MIQAILTDIEGTTSSIAFVKEVLFPYARAHIGTFCHTHQNDPEVAELLAQARGEEALSLEQTIARLEHWIDTDQKITALKALQGMIWADGYQSGGFQGHMYEDATEMLKRWHTAGIGLYVYSSGSVPAQKLLFGHSTHGDLTPLFSGYFDTRIGHKREVESYRRIAEAIDHSPEAVLFLSDVVEELDAAEAAGMQTFWLLREGDNPPGEHRRARDFGEIQNVLEAKS